MNAAHLTADLAGCSPHNPLMTDAAALQNTCLAAVTQAGLRAVGQCFYPFPQALPVHGSATDEASWASCGGVTGVVLLAQSHLAVHTWPERRAVTVDVLVCNVGEDDTPRAHALIQALVRCFEAQAVSYNSLSRPLPKAETDHPQHPKSPSP